MTMPESPTPESTGKQPASSRVGDDLGLGLTIPGRGTVDDQGHRRVHPISPIVHGISTVPVGIVIIVLTSTGLFSRWGLSAIWLVLGLIILVPLVVAGWSYVAWRNLWFWFDDDGDFRIDSGVFTKQQRRLQLSRLQSVDVSQPLVARLFSMAEVVVEVAGMQESRVKLQFLQLDDARALRSELLARAAGLRHDVGEAPEAPMASVTPRDLAVSLVMRTVTAGLLLVTIVIIVITVLSSGSGGLALAVVTGGLPILIVVAEFIKYFNFTVSRSPDGLRLRFGLAKTETRTVPPGRVQAIEYI